MQEQFNISTEEEILPHKSRLAFQVGSNFIGFCIHDPINNQLLQLKRYGLKTLSVENLQMIIEKNSILNNNFEKIITGLNFGCSTLLPTGFSSNDSTPLMYLENADQQDHIIEEEIPGFGASNVYTVPPQVLTWWVQHFPSSTYFHTHTIQVLSAKGFSQNGLLRIDFSENLFSVTAFENDSLLLAKTYQYRNPVDVIFYLLKIAEVFGFKQDRVTVLLSGMIDERSKLYQEVYNYFLNTSMAPASWICSNTDIPSHYFTALNELVVCELFQEI